MPAKFWVDDSSRVGDAMVVVSGIPWWMGSVLCCSVAFRDGRKLDLRDGSRFAHCGHRSARFIGVSFSQAMVILSPDMLRDVGRWAVRERSPHPPLVIEKHIPCWAYRTTHSATITGRRGQYIMSELLSSVWQRHWSGPGMEKEAVRGTLM